MTEKVIPSSERNSYIDELISNIGLNHFQKLSPIKKKLVLSQTADIILSDSSNTIVSNHLKMKNDPKKMADLRKSLLKLLMKVCSEEQLERVYQSGLMTSVIPSPSSSDSLTSHESTLSLSSEDELFSSPTISTSSEEVGSEKTDQVVSSVDSNEGWEQLQKALQTQNSNVQVPLLESYSRPSFILIAESIWREKKAEVANELMKSKKNFLVKAGLLNANENDYTLIDATYHQYKNQLANFQTEQNLIKELEHQFDKVNLNSQKSMSLSDFLYTDAKTDSQAFDSFGDVGIPREELIIIKNILLSKNDKDINQLLVEPYIYNCERAYILDKFEHNGYFKVDSDVDIARLDKLTFELFDFALQTLSSSENFSEEFIKDILPKDIYQDMPKETLILPPLMPIVGFSFTMGVLSAFLTLAFWQAAVTLFTSVIAAGIIVGMAGFSAPLAILLISALAYTAYNQTTDNSYAPAPMRP